MQSFEEKRLPEAGSCRLVAQSSRVREKRKVVADKWNPSQTKTVTKTVQVNRHSQIGHCVGHWILLGVSLVIGIGPHWPPEVRGGQSIYHCGQHSLLIPAVTPPSRSHLLRFLFSSGARKVCPLSISSKVSIVLCPLPVPLPVPVPMHWLPVPNYPSAHPWVLVARYETANFPSFSSRWS